jgi:DNA polymerase III psi subunit
MVDFFFDVPEKIIENPDGFKVLLVIKKKDSKIENIKLVENILKSINLNMDQCQLEMIEEKCLIGNTMTSFEKIIGFGINPSELGININFKPYSTHKISETKLLFAHSLTDLSTNADYKKNLWQGLQVMFDIVKK